MLGQEEEWLIARATPSTWNAGSNWPRWSENANFQSIFARSASAVTPSKKSSIITNMKSTTSFPMSLRWTSYVASKPPKGLKNAKRPVSVKSNFNWRNSAAKVLCLKIVYRVEMISGDVPLYAKIWPKRIYHVEKRRFSIYFRSYRLSRNA